MAGHSNAKTTELYDRRNDDVSVGEVERIGI
jgi:integrase/recombinase XerD